MTKDDVMAELEALGTEQTKKTFRNHGAREPFFGVKVGDLKMVLKKIRNDQALAMELYQTGNSDAMYLAGLVADGSKMSKAELQDWAEKAYWHMLSEYTVPWVASESPLGWEIALEWIDSGEERIAAAGWSTLAALVSVRPDDELDKAALGKLLALVEREIHRAPNRVRYTMNIFVISVAGYMAGLAGEAEAAAQRIGRVTVDMGGTACGVPFAPDYIKKMRARGMPGKKKKTAKC